MALAQEKVFMSVTLVDAGGNKSTLQYDLDYASLDALNTGHTTDDAILGTAGIIEDLEAVTDASVQSVSFGVRYADETVTYGPAGSEVERQAVISAKLDGREEYATVKIPAPNVGLFVAETGANRNTVDATDTALLAYLNNFNPSGKIKISDGEHIDDPATAGNIKGKQVHRGSRKG